jgi:negative regulator of flagellin synthesis FlgM
MADKISGYGRNNLEVGGTRGKAAARQAGEQARAKQSSSDAAPAAVRLTDTAVTLKQVEARLAAQPDVDAARVAAVRQRVESGNYQINSGRLADRILAFERDLV